MTVKWKNHFNDSVTPPITIWVWKQTEIMRVCKHVWLYMELNGKKFKGRKTIGEMLYVHISIHIHHTIRKSLIDNFHNKSTTKKRKEKKLEVLNIWTDFLSTTFLFAIPRKRNEKNNIKIKSIHTYSLLAQKVHSFFSKFLPFILHNWYRLLAPVFHYYEKWRITERRFVDVPEFGVRVSIRYGFALLNNNNNNWLADAFLEQ